VKVLLICTLIAGNFSASAQCPGKVRLAVIRQEKFNGCGSDFIGADMRVIYQLSNNSDHPIYVYGFSDDNQIFPNGYVLSFNEKTKGWDYPTGDNKPVHWSEISSEFKSVKKLDVGKSIVFEACHSTAERGKMFARTVYISCDAKSIPAEFISDSYTIATLK